MSRALNGRKRLPAVPRQSHLAIAMAEIQKRNQAEPTLLQAAKTVVVLTRWSDAVERR